MTYKNFISSVLCAGCLSLSAALFSPLEAVDTSLPWDEYKAQTCQVVLGMEGWCTPEKASRMMDIVATLSKGKKKTFVEVGVYGGRSFLPAAAALQFIGGEGRAYAIDPWAVDPCLVGESGVNYDWWSHLDLDAILRGFLKTMSREGLDNRMMLMRMTSQEASNEFKKGSIDILHIDGNHSEQVALQDAQNWLPLVKKGGYIIFDDADWASTKLATDFLGKHCKLDAQSAIGDAYLVFIKK